jgi:DNA-binding TFAR19-related protein (PDSD5 family)
LSEDKELERILEKKRKRLLNRLAKASEENRPQKKESVDDVDKLVLSLLDEKGREVLTLAERDFPEETKKAKLILYALVRKGFVEGPVDAGDFYRFLRYLGIPVRYESRVTVVSKGERKPLSEILAEKISELEQSV